jgi:hypothetical protein
MPDRHIFFNGLLNSESEIIRLYSVWALWRMNRLNTINKESFYKTEFSKNVIQEYELLKK